MKGYTLNKIDDLKGCWPYVFISRAINGVEGVEIKEREVKAFNLGELIKDGNLDYVIHVPVCVAKEKLIRQFEKSTHKSIRIGPKHARALANQWILLKADEAIRKYEWDNVKNKAHEVLISASYLPFTYGSGSTSRPVGEKIKYELKRKDERSIVEIGFRFN